MIENQRGTCFKIDLKVSAICFFIRLQSLVQKLISIRIKYPDADVSTIQIKMRCGTIYRPGQFLHVCINLDGCYGCIPKAKHLDLHIVCQRISGLSGIGDCF